jgi:four helix bundle protein
MIEKMMNQEQLKNRTKEFALRVIRLVDALPSTIAGKNIGNQIMRSGTSVAANYRAACRARSRAEFTAKLGTVVEEAYETAFWLELIVESGILPKDKIDLLHREANELSAIFVASRKTASKSSIINRQSKIGDHR